MPEPKQTEESVIEPTLASLLDRVAGLEQKLNEATAAKKKLSPAERGLLGARARWRKHRKVTKTRGRKVRDSKEKIIFPELKELGLYGAFAIPKDDPRRANYARTYYEASLLKRKVRTLTKSIAGGAAIVVRVK